MSRPAEHSVGKAEDSIQQRLTDYACSLTYNDLSPEAIHAAKVRIIDTLGALVSGFFGESGRIGRTLAGQVPNASGATVIGTRMKTTLDLAAFVNATAARYPEMTDSYHWPGTAHGHASDSITPVLGVAESMRASGREFITSVVLAYEIFLRISDVFHNNKAFDTTNFACLGVAVAAGRLMGLSSEQLSHSISMAVVPNVVLTQVRRAPLTMFKAAASGQAGRAGVFASLLARAGMEGPRLPFEGKAGWCDHVARERFSLNTLGGKGVRFKILDTQIKNRASCGGGISSVLAAEKVAPLKNIKDVEHVTVEVYNYAKENSGTGEHRWNPDSRETADHSIPFIVAATLKDGTISPRSYNDANLWNPELRALMQKIKVVENEDFTSANNRIPQEHRARVTVTVRGSAPLVGEAGGDQDDMAVPKSDAQIAEKFRVLSEDTLGAKRVNAILESLWHLEDLKNMAEIPPAFAFS